VVFQRSPAPAVTILASNHELVTRAYGIAVGIDHS
jgi:hypothetical protein